MKKRIDWSTFGYIALIVVIVIGALAAIIIPWVGSSGQQKVKNIKSNLNGGLERTIKVYDCLTKEVLWEFEGKGYIDGNSETGNVTIVYYTESGESKKVDFIGNSISVVSIEK